MVDETKTEAGGDDWRQSKERRGVVVKANTANTVVVEVTRRVAHGEYGKIQTRGKKYAVHDLVGCKVGDEVIIRETRPVSKTKRWRVVKKVAAHGGAS
ncbi:MAG: 30S ribosomal protein S17 [Myxococcota bacterium]